MRRIASLTSIKLLDTFDSNYQVCSGARTRWDAVPSNILEPERRSGKYRWPQVERIPANHVVLVRLTLDQFIFWPIACIGGYSVM